MHTKGPWEARNVGGGMKVWKGIRIIADTTREPMPIEEAQANARLIAVAPELYREFIVSIERGFALGYSCEDQLELYKKITGEEYDFDSAIAKGE